MSNLLQKASIVTTPTAYGVGVLNSIKPAIPFGEELVTNGDFANTSWWQLSSSNVNISNGKGNFTAGTTEYFYKNNILTIGKTYKVTFEITDYTTGYLSAFGGNWSGAAVGVGTYVRYINNSVDTTFGIVGNTFIGSIDNVSVKEQTDADFDFTRNSSATRVNPDYLIETSATNTPRLDYTNGTASILLENQSTNVLPYFKDFSQYALGGNSSLTYESNIIAPDGTLGVYRLNLLAASESYLLLGTYIGQNLSVYAKSVNPNSNNQFTFYSQNGASGIKTTTANWERFDNDFGSSVNSQCYINNDGDSYATDIYIWGVQFEAQSYPTSIIPTSGSAVTRAAESLNNAGNSSLINSTEGVLYCEIASLADDLTNRIISISDGTSNNRVLILYQVASNKIRGQFSVSGQSSKTIDHIVDTTQFRKIAFSWNSTSVKLYIDGQEIGETTTGFTFSANSLSELAFDNVSGGNFYGRCKTVAVFKEALSDTELACLTSTNNREIFLNYYYRMQYVGANTEALSCAEQTFNI